MEIDQEIISTAILLPSANLRRVFVSYKQKYVQEVLVNCLFRHAQEKSVFRWTDRPAMTLAVDLGRKATKQTNKQNPKFLNYIMELCIVTGLALVIQITFANSLNQDQARQNF